MQKVERLVNLIALLLNTRRPLTVEEIRNTIPGYQQSDYSSFKRMFERDKEELRAVGIPIERRFTDVWEVEEGYLISKDRYYLPELDLTPDEVAALWISSQIVAEERGKEDQALLKLQMGTGLGGGTSPQPWLRARLHLDVPALPTMLDAVAGRRRVRFRYQGAGRAKESERTMDPYALIHRQGAWYVLGHDHLRSAVRHFKLQRITSKVTYTSRETGPDFDLPEDFSVDDHRLGDGLMGREGTTVEVAFSPRLAWWALQTLGLEPTGTWKGWTTTRLEVTDEEGFVGWILGFGEDAVVRSPDRLRKAVTTRLRAFLRGSSSPRKTKPRTVAARAAQARRR